MSSKIAKRAMTLTVLHTSLLFAHFGWSDVITSKINKIFFGKMI